jgi:hypothetical protein
MLAPNYIALIGAVIGVIAITGGIYYGVYRLNEYIMRPHRNPVQHPGSRTPRRSLPSPNSTPIIIISPGAVREPEAGVAGKPVRELELGVAV